MEKPSFRSWPERAPWVAAITAVVAVLVVAGVGFWIKAQGNGPLAIDSWWYGVVSATPGSPVMQLAMTMHVLGGTAVAAVCVVSVTLAMLLSRRWRDAVAMALAGLLGLVCSDTLKAMLERPRPPAPVVLEHSYSFPSGHSMGAAMLMVSVALIVAGARGSRDPLAITVWAIASVWVLTMMWSRAAVQVHWLSDTLAGAVLGVAVAILARTLAYLPRRNIAKYDDSVV